MSKFWKHIEAMAPNLIGPPDDEAETIVTPSVEDRLLDDPSQSRWIPAIN